jgi:hypothetical protein
MAVFSPKARWTMGGAALLAVGVACLPACKGGRSNLPPPMPVVQRVELWKPPVGGGERIRGNRGEDIAPVVLADDPAPTAAPPGAAGEGAARGSLNGHPNGITRESLNRSIQGVMGSLAACFTNITQDPMVAVSFEADPSGRPSLVRVNGAPPDAEHCIRNVVQGIRFPGFEGKGVQVDLPLSFHRTRPVQQQTAEQQGQAAPPPMFLEP